MYGWYRHGTDWCSTALQQVTSINILMDTSRDHDISGSLLWHCWIHDKYSVGLPLLSIYRASSLYLSILCIYRDPGHITAEVRKAADLFSYQTKCGSWAAFCPHCSHQHGTPLRRWIRKWTRYYLFDTYLWISLGTILFMHVLSIE